MSDWFPPGPLSVPFGLDGNAFINTGTNKDPLWPDIQLVMQPQSPAVDGGVMFGNQIGFRMEVSYTALDEK